VRLLIINRLGLQAMLALTFALASLRPIPVHALPQTPAPIRKIYVDTFQGKLGSNQLRERVIECLRANGKWQLVDAPSEADAVVRGTGEIWVQGHVATRPHSAVRETVYNGYLSLDLTNRSGETLWSYLVTPGRMYSDVAQGMANHIVRLMVAALAQGAPHDASAAAISGSQVVLAGAGSTFAAALYQDWIESFDAQHPQVHTTYQAVGSEEGMDLLKAGKVDFAASDVPLSDEQMAGMQVKYDNFATVLGGVVPAYNLRGVGSDLRFTGAILAGIYLGKITRWNDPALRAINHWASLPDQPIAVVHRSDGSGTTFTFTHFLSAAALEWKSAIGAGMRVSWPVGVAAQGNDGVAAKVAETPGAIGYVELTYALRYKLSFGLVKNTAGRFVQANLATLSEAARGAPKFGDIRASLVNTAASDAYPITTFTWILLPASSDSPQKTAALRDLLRWMLTSGQKECAGLSYLPLPREIAAQELRKLVSPDLGTSPNP
jgi:phosphate ABC transporter phosphate-binding protein